MTSLIILNAISMLDLQSHNKARSKICDITIQSDLTINDDLNQLKHTLIGSTEKYDVINIQSLDEIELDICFVQLVISLKNEAKRQDKEVHLMLKISERSLELLKKSGLSAQILTE